ncbi:MAG: ATP-binding domain-containing protein, partial [Clostridia bacterium]|nr:ATP-binding domain-containing protein [Clostridia bacterium]
DVLRRIFGKNNVLLCGDFFQTVYGWRGSNPEKVLDAYCKEFCAKTYMFSANYRSTKTLTAATFGYLKNTYPAFMGKYCPASIEAQGEDGGDKIRCFGFDNRKEEAFQIFNYAKKHPQNLCIMARSNKYIAYLYERFEAENRQLPEEERVRFFTVEENHQFYKKSVVKDILAVLRLVSDDTDAISMERLAGRYIGGVGIRTLEKLRSMQPLGVSVVSFLDKRVYNEQDPYRVLIESFQKGEVVVYDTETTGLDVLRDEMVQLSAVRLNGAGEITDALDLMIEPNVEIGKGAYETHGFDLAYIRSHGGVSAKVALEKFSAFCQGAILVGHNSLRFDSPLIKRQLAENGLPPIDVCGEYDTLLLAKRFLPGLSDYKLSTLCKQFGIVNENAHNAFGDIVATGKVLACLLKEYVLPTALERVNAVATYKEKFSKFFAFIQAVKGLVERNDNKALIPYIAESMRLYKRYTNIADWQAIEELKSYFAELATANLSAFLRGYLADASLSGSQMDILVKRTSSIPIVTVHQAKGCEFDTVIVAGADENHFPSFMARETGSEDEERRVFYVALTRAKKKLILTRAVYNGSRVVDPTPYFWQIPQTYTLTNENWLMTKETAGQVFDE